tara:strand:+ start:389 stop:1273 length:885 start_codon:yes stop_codon:yes gene_type:complete
MYHRISENGKSGSISAHKFNEQMRIIKKYFNPMSLNKLVELYDKGQLPNYAVAITFDDGYRDFAEYAFPILKNEKIPVTLFVTTGFINGDLWLWPDCLKYIIDKEPVKIKWIIKELSKDIKVSDNNHDLWNEVADYCMTIPESEKNIFIDKLYDYAQLEKPKKAPEGYRPLSWEQLKEMRKYGLEIGSHSHTHPILTQLTPEELSYELEVSKQQISQNLYLDPVAFCYPNGLPGDFNNDIEKATENAGYKYALAAFPGRYPIENRWAINRYASSESEENFKKVLFGWTYLGMKV